MLCATGYVLIAKRLSRRYSHWPSPACKRCWAASGLAWLAEPLGPLAQPFSALAQPDGGVPGVFVTLGAYGLYTWAVSKMPVSRASPFINLIPLFTVLLAWWLLGETLAAAQWLACLLVLGGVLLGRVGLQPCSLNVKFGKNWSI
jgi:drug/metabolite transporter (DMT)-like permease